MKPRELINYDSKSFCFEQRKNRIEKEYMEDFGDEI